MEFIEYQAGFKYQLVSDYRTTLPLELCPQYDIRTYHIDLSTAGELVIRKGYAWDGATDPAIDTRQFMRGSLVHDALYQLMRETLLPLSCRDAADRVLRRMCQEDGMGSLRAWWVYRGLKVGGGPAADPRSTRPVLVAPRRPR